MTSLPFRLTSDPTPRTPFTAKTGMKAYQAGKSLEEMIEFSAGCQRDVVTLEHLPRMGAIMLAGRKPIITRICVDFIGCLNEYEDPAADHGLVPIMPARPLFFDAKSCGKNTKGFDANQWHKEREHQCKFLRRMGKAGAVAGLLIRSEERGLFLWGDILHVDVLDTVTFARNGVLCRQWLSLGHTTGLVDFRALRAAYQ